VQDLVLDAPDVKVSFHRSTPIQSPLVVDGRTILEPGSPVVWFTFPGRWHDIGRFHRVDGRFTGIYANVLTPPEMSDSVDGVVEWRTTDLFLDIWVGTDGEVRILDEDEWAAARDRNDLDPTVAARAMQEARVVFRDARKGQWPPPVVAEWTLDRARTAADPSTD
jgi:predicted RNA-binding protein associated with RNAse of E/G family